MNPWITWGIVAALFIGREVYRARRERRLNRTLELLEWRERFARTRSDIVHLMHCGELAPDSIVAVSTYMVSSAMVRRASNYHEFAQGIVGHLLLKAIPDDKFTNKLKHELRALSPDAKAVFLRYLDDVHQHLLAYSWLYRLIAWLSRNFKPLNVTTKPRHRGHVHWRRFDDRLASYRTQARLRQLAAA